MNKACAICTNIFVTVGSNKYCSEECSNVARKKQRRDFYIAHADKIKTKSEEYYRTNKPRVSVTAKLYRGSNKTVIASRKLYYKFGITLKQAKELLTRQGECCAICKTHLCYDTGIKGKDTPSIDHDHKTGKIRGIVCMGCNIGLGMFKDSIESLRAAINYLEKK